MSSLFSIAIPTFNRADLLKKTLKSALNQTYENIEIVVSDDGSDDNTKALIESFNSDKIIYNRNKQNIGSMANFVKAFEMASGKYFSFLQDDDILCKDFVEKACNGLNHSDDITLYYSFAISTKNIEFVHGQLIHGTPLRLDWINKTPRIIPGKLWIPFSLIAKTGNPPTVAFKTKILRKYIKDCYINDGELLTERKIAAANASAGNVFIDPNIGAINRIHDGQRNFILKNETPNIRHLHFLNMVDYLQTLAEPIDKWENEFLELIKESDSFWKNKWLDQTRSWPNDKWLCSGVKKILEDQVFEVIDDKSYKFFKQLKLVIKLILPPILIEIFRLSKNILMYQNSNTK